MLASVPPTVTMLRDKHNILPPLSAAGVDDANKKRPGRKINHLDPLYGHDYGGVTAPVGGPSAPLCINNHQRRIGRQLNSPNYGDLSPGLRTWGI